MVVFLKRCVNSLTFCHRFGQFRCLVLIPRCVFSQLGGFPKSSDSVDYVCCDADVVISSTQHEDRKFFDVVPSLSVEEAPLRAAELTETCCELVRAAKLDVELFKVLTSCPFRNYLLLQCTGLRLWVGCLVLRLSITVCKMVVCSVLATIPRVELLRHLWSLVDRHGCWDEEMGVSDLLAKHLYELCNCSVSMYLLSGGLLGCKVSSLCPHLINSVVCSVLSCDDACVGYVLGCIWIKHQDHLLGDIGPASGAEWCVASFINSIGCCT